VSAVIPCGFLVAVIAALIGRGARGYAPKRSGSAPSAAAAAAPVRNTRPGEIFQDSIEQAARRAAAWRARAPVSMAPAPDDDAYRA